MEELKKFFGNSIRRARAFFTNNLSLSSIALRRTRLKGDAPMKLTQCVQWRLLLSILSGACKSSQNGRGGLFYVVDNAELAKSVADLITGGTAPQ